MEENNKKVFRSRSFLPPHMLKVRFGSLLHSFGGFTLIELLVVLVIFVLTITLVSPVIFSGFKNMKLKTTAKRTITMLNYARALAISEKQVYYARVIDDRLLILNGENKDIKNEFSIPEEVKMETRQGDTISFYPSGASSGGIFEVHDRTNKPFCLIMVGASTGRARYKEL